MRSHPGIFSAQEKQWDPVEVLDLINPDRGCVTCTAEAVTYGRRCRRKQYCIDDAVYKLRDMATMDPLSAAKSDKLSAIAQQSVCYQHGRQVDQICSEWRRKLRALGSSRNAPASPRSPSVIFKTEPDSDDEDEDVKWFTQRPSQPAYSQADIRSMLDQIRRMEETINNMQSQNQQKAAEQKRKQAEEEQLRKEKAERAQRQQEAERKENEERERKEREEEERLRKEKAQKAQRERQEAEKRERQQREQQERERKARENKEREDRIKERARRSAQEREQAIRKQWTDSWEEYVDGWDHLKGKSCREAAPILIPWPVKSGKWEDVTAESIKLFFHKAPPMPSSLADAKEERFRLMSQESKKWHTDKIMQLFGREVLSGKHGKALGLVATIVVELRQEAQRARKD